MSLTPLLITYYNIIPPNATNYFTIQDNKLILSYGDMFGSSTNSFINNINNNLVYIFNGQNMGSLTINSSVPSGDSPTYIITLNSIPPNLTDGILCVLSSNVPNYNITRTFLDDNIGNFTYSNNTFTINTKSINSVLSDATTSNYNQKITVEYDDTLFLYIIATNKSFNIIFSPTSIITVNNVQIQKESNKSKIIFTTSDSSLKFNMNIQYILYIPIENSTTISNITFNGTGIKSLTNNSNNSDMLVTTPAIVAQPISLNKLNSKPVISIPIPLNQSVILNIQNPNYHNLSGYFSFGSIESFTSKIDEHYTQPNMKNSLLIMVKNSYNAIIPKDYHKTIGNISNNASDIYKTAFEYLSYNQKTYVAKSKELPKPDNITNVQLLSGLPTQLNISYNDVNNNQINFITPNIIIYLSNGLTTYIYSISNSINNPLLKTHSILSFNGEINSTSIPDYTKNIPYVISSGPISPYHTFKYVNNLPIGDGAFSLKSSGNAIILSNTDMLSNNAIPFISLLYTIIDNQSILLNILNLDYSLACSLLITGVSLDQLQSTITFNIISGSVPSGSSNYFFTLLHSNELITSMNNSKTYKKLFTTNSNLLLNIQNAIQNSFINNPNNSNIQTAQLIISNAVSQSIILLNTPFINTNNTSLQISNAIITMGYNAINYALLGDPKSIELKSQYKSINQLSNPVIVTSILNNALYHVNNLLKTKPKQSERDAYEIAKNALTNALNVISTPSALDSPTIPDPSYPKLINNAITEVNNAIKVSPGQDELLKAQAILATIESFSSGIYHEGLTSDTNIYIPSSSEPRSYFDVFCGIICCILFLVIIAAIINLILTKDDAKKISSELSSSDELS